MGIQRIAPLFALVAVATGSLTGFKLLQWVEPPPSVPPAHVAQVMGYVRFSLNEAWLQNQTAMESHAETETSTATDAGTESTPDPKSPSAEAPVETNSAGAASGGTESTETTSAVTASAGTASAVTASTGTSLPESTSSASLSPSLELTPPPLPALGATPILITVHGVGFEKGRKLPPMVVVSPNDVGQDPHAALKVASEQLAYKIAAIPGGFERLPDARIQVDLVGPERPIPTFLPSLLELIVDPGRDGLVARTEGASAWMPPAFLVYRSWDTGNALKDLREQVGEGATFSRFRSQAFVEGDSGLDAVLEAEEGASLLPTRSPGTPGDMTSEVKAAAVTPVAPIATTAAVSSGSAASPPDTAPAPASAPDASPAPAKVSEAANLPLPLFRGNVLLSEVTPQTLLQSFQLASGYLSRMVKSDGRYCYTYLAHEDRCDKDYNLLRHAGTTYSLYQLLPLKSTPEHFASAERAIAWLRNQMRPVKGKPDHVFVLEGKSAKLGGAGLSLLALAEREEVVRDGHDLQLMNALGRFIRSQQRDDGFLYSWYDWQKDGPGAGANSIYYPGEALLGMVRLYKLTSDPTVFETIQKAADYLAFQRWNWGGIELYVPPDAWLTQALAELYPLLKAKQAPDAERIKAYVYRLVDVTLQSQLLAEDNAPPDMVGGPAGGILLPSVTPAGARSEGLAAALHMARAAGDDGRARQIQTALLQSARFQLNQQFRPANAFYLPNPARALGGFRSNAAQNDIRIDYVQHNVSGLIGLYEDLTRGEPGTDKTLLKALMSPSGAASEGAASGGAASQGSPVGAAIDGTAAGTEANPRGYPGLNESLKSSPPLKDPARAALLDTARAALPGPASVAIPGAPSTTDAVTSGTSSGAAARPSQKSTREGPP